VTGEQPKTAFAGWFKSEDPNPFAGQSGVVSISSSAAREQEL
jgi:hypothetical protein